MIRASMVANSAFAYLAVRPDGTLDWLTRVTAGTLPALRASQAATLGETWVRLTRTGNSFSASYSTNGTDFAGLGDAVSITMPGNALVGIASTSFSIRYAGVSTFSGLALTGAVGALQQAVKVRVLRCQCGHADADREAHDLTVYGAHALAVLHTLAQPLGDGAGAP